MELKVEDEDLGARGEKTIVSREKEDWSIWITLVNCQFRECHGL